MLFKNILAAVAFSGVLGAVTSANAGSVDVSYTVTGSAGSWAYDFSVTNNLGGTNGIYFFGVEISPATSSSPSGWSVFGPWSNANFGGSSTNYDLAWITNDSAFWINNGETMDRFEVTNTGATALTHVAFYVFALGGEYTGPHFNIDTNPGIEGTAMFISAIPEPEIYAMLSVGLGLIGWVGRRKHPQAA